MGRTSKCLRISVRDAASALASPLKATARARSRLRKRPRDVGKAVIALGRSVVRTVARAETPPGGSRAYTEHRNVADRRSDDGLVPHTRVFEHLYATHRETS